MKRRWAIQASFEIADDPELLKAMTDGGCVGVFVGLETFSAEALSEQDKEFNKPLHYREAVRTLHRHGSFFSHCTEQHPNEAMHLLVFSHPYHTTSAPGVAATLDSVPPGAYRLGIWTTGRGIPGPDTVLDVTVAPNEPVSVSVEVTNRGGT